MCQNIPNDPVMQGHYKECPYYQNDDEYAVVRHQM